MLDLANNLEKINEPYIIGLYNVDSGVPYDKAAVVILDVQDGEDLASAVERHGVACESIGGVHKALQKR